MNGQDHYGVLGISPDAGQASIRAAYRAQMKRHHPDLNPGREGADGIAASINLAYEVLSDPVSRSRYDRERLQATRNSRGYASQSGSRGTRYRGRQHARTGSHEGSAQHSEDHGPEHRSSPQDASRSATLSVLGRILWTMAVAVMLAIEVLSVPVVMMGIGAVLFVFGALITVEVASNYILMVLLSAPAVVIGIAIIRRSVDELPRVVGLLIACAGVFLFLAGVYMTVTTAPSVVALTLVGAAITGFAVRTGRRHGGFTSKRVHLVS